MSTFTSDKINNQAVASSEELIFREAVKSAQGLKAGSCSLRKVCLERLEKVLNNTV